MDRMQEFAGIEINKIEMTPVFVPFKKEIVEVMRAGAGGLGMALASEEPWLGGDFVICRIFADSGHSGVGEAFVWLPETGETPANLVAMVKDHGARYVLGQNPFNLPKILKRLDNNIARNEVAKGLIDMALWDLQGQIAKKSVAELIGVSSIGELPLSGLVPLAAIPVMKEIALLFAAEGMKTFRFKLGLGAEKDAEIIKTMREILDGAARFRVDYNQAYGVEEAIAAINAIAPYGIDAAEQPVAARSFAAMAAVQKQVSVPLMPHEGCFGFDDIETLVALGAIRVIGINSERPGGITLALKAIDLAKRHNLSVVLHNQPLGIASSMMIHLGCARFHDLGHSPEILGHVMLEDDLIKKPIDYDGGKARLPQGSGLAVELDEEALQRYATGPTAVVR